MDYHRIYSQLVSRARNRVLEGYKERHHVVPRCLGGSNEASNLVNLTGPEHAVAHLLLVKMYPGNLKLVFAANIMLVNANGIRYPMSRNKQYGWLKEKAAKAMGDVRRGAKNSEESKRKTSAKMKDRKKTPEHVAKVKAALTGKPGTRTGVTTPDETRAKQSAAAYARPDKAENDRKMREGSAAMTQEQREAAMAKAWDTRRKNGTDQFSDAQRAKMSASQLARDETQEEAVARGLKAAQTRRERGTDKRSDESREKMRQSQLGKKQSPETVAKRQATIARSKALKAATIQEIH
jgi:hypothetical protein